MLAHLPIPILTRAAALHTIRVFRRAFQAFQGAGGRIETASEFLLKRCVEIALFRFQNNLYKPFQRLYSGVEMVFRLEKRIWRQIEIARFRAAGNAVERVESAFQKAEFRGRIMTNRNERGKRTRVIKPYPAYTLEDVLEIADTIQNANAGLPFERALLAGALGTTPKSSAFTMRLNASAAYGLTQGGYNDAEIRLTPLGQAAASEDDARREQALAAAAMTPGVFGKFYELLDGKRLPESAAAQSILRREQGVAESLTEECLSIIIANGEYAGLLREENGAAIVRIGARAQPQAVASQASPDEASQSTQPALAPAADEAAVADATSDNGRNAGREGKVFVGHIGESEAARFVASMLEQFGIPIAKPDFGEDGRPAALSGAAGEMRTAGAAALVFAGGARSQDARDGMLCMLGACLALYGERVVIFHETDAVAGLNLDGLSCVGFERERIAESGLGLLMGLHKAGVVSVSA